MILNGKSFKVCELLLFKNDCNSEFVVEFNDKKRENIRD